MSKPKKQCNMLIYRLKIYNRFEAQLAILARTWGGSLTMISQSTRTRSVRISISSYGQWHLVGGATVERGQSPGLQYSTLIQSTSPFSNGTHWSIQAPWKAIPAKWECWVTPGNGPRGDFQYCQRRMWTGFVFDWVGWTWKSFDG